MIKKYVRIMLIALMIPTFLVGCGEEKKPQALNEATSIAISEATASLGGGKHIQWPVMLEYAYSSEEEELYNNSELVIVGEYVKREGVEIDKDPLMTYTTDRYKVVSVIKNKNNITLEGETIKIKYVGGKVPLSKYIEAISPEAAKEQGLDQLTKEEISKGTFEVVSMDDESKVTPNESKKGKFKIFLNRSEESENTFRVLCDGYGFIKI